MIYFPPKENPQKSQDEKRGILCFPCTIIHPCQEAKFGRMSVKTTPHAINVWMPVKIQFFSLKQIYKLFCNVFERLRAEHILAVSHLAFLDCGKASGTSAWNRWALPAAGKGPLCSHPGEGAPVSPSSPGGPKDAANGQWNQGGTEKRTTGDGAASFTVFLPLIPLYLPFWVFISERTTMALLSPCQGLNGGKVRVWHTEHRHSRVRNM